LDGRQKKLKNIYNFHASEAGKDQNHKKKV